MGLDLSQSLIGNPTGICVLELDPSRAVYDEYRKFSVIRDTFE